uniref:Uncharacterized protein n=1 Tax=Anguilla anguilla TaxID=7936 RepID=A0A0E9Q3E2_ANGAN
MIVWKNLSHNHCICRTSQLCEVPCVVTKQMAYQSASHPENHWMIFLLYEFSDAYINWMCG